MHKNAIKIVWGVKNCALFTKNMAPFGEKKFVRLFVRFLAKLGALLKSKHLEALIANQEREIETLLIYLSYICIFLQFCYYNII